MLQPDGEAACKAAQLGYLSDRGGRKTAGRCKLQPSGRLAPGSMVQDDGHHTYPATGEAVVAIVTPFTSNGEIDEAGLRVYLQLLHDKGIEHIVVNGTTGEFWAMTLEERRRVLVAARRHWLGTLTVNVSACSLGDVFALLDHCSTLAEEGGRQLADAALLLPSFYYERAGPAGIGAFLAAALAHAKLPVFLYNYPRHTGNTVTPELFRELRSRFPLMQGIKNSEMSLEDCAAFQTDCDAAVLVGTEDLCRALDQGFEGFVTGGAGSVLPEAVAQLHRAHRAGQVDLARELQRNRIDSWMACSAAMQCEFIAATKAALSMIVPGFSPVVRPPLLPADAADMQRLQDFVRQHDLHRK